MSLSTTLAIAWVTAGWAAMGYWVWVAARRQREKAYEERVTLLHSLGVFFMVTVFSGLLGFLMWPLAAGQIREIREER